MILLRASPHLSDVPAAVPSDAMDAMAAESDADAAAAEPAPDAPDEPADVVLDDVAADAEAADDVPSVPGSDGGVASKYQDGFGRSDHHNGRRR